MDLPALRVQPPTLHHARTAIPYVAPQNNTFVFVAAAMPCWMEFWWSRSPSYLSPSASHSIHLFDNSPLEISYLMLNFVDANHVLYLSLVSEVASMYLSVATYGKTSTCKSVSLNINLRRCLDTKILDYI